MAKATPPDDETRVRPFADAVREINAGKSHDELSVALRADIDALPIQEATGLEFSSQNPGVAHMCGHDIHTTVMLGVATVLADLNRTSPLSGRVRVLFQPAEEQLPGGALTVIEQDVLEGVPRAHRGPLREAGGVGAGAYPRRQGERQSRLHDGGWRGRCERILFPRSQRERVRVTTSVSRRRVTSRAGCHVLWPFSFRKAIATRGSTPPTTDDLARMFKARI